MVHGSGWLATVGWERVWEGQGGSSVAMKHDLWWSDPDGGASSLPTYEYYSLFAKVKKERTLYGSVWLGTVGSGQGGEGL